MDRLRAAATIKLMGRGTEREAVWRNRYANAVLSILMGLQTVLVIYFATRM